jgi:hypothetical protein
MSGREGQPRWNRTRWIVTACVTVMCVAGTALASAATLDRAETFPPIPKPGESRCAPVHISAHLVSIGTKIEATAGPASSSCGGPASKVHWAWPDDTPHLNEIQGLVKTGPCPGTSRHCEFRARLFNAAGEWQGICISGVSPQGAFTSCDPYAVKIGDYHYLTGTIFGANKPVKVTITGPGGRQTDETDGQVWTFAVKNGTYGVSFTANGKHFKRTVKVHAKPGTAVTLNLDAA